MPADGLFLKGNELRMDESAMTGETQEVSKSEDHPFIFSGTTGGAHCRILQAGGAVTVPRMGPKEAVAV